MEPFYNQYRDILNELNGCVRTSGVPLHGNLFYIHDDTTNRMAEAFQGKRMDFCDFVMNSDCIVEIGFNAGHSALLGLTANQDIIYRSVDIGQPYSIACFDVLKARFGDRIDLTVGDSLDVIPRIKEIYPEISGRIGWFIDGDHSYEYCKQDLDNVLFFADNDDLIFIDDTNQRDISKLMNEYLSNNIIRMVKEGRYHMVVTRS